ncbi:MAG: hypothetical protein NVS1B7_4630 [Candidatus Saccharimonadales bacterium]
MQDKTAKLASLTIIELQKSAFTDQSGLNEIFAVAKDTQDLGEPHIANLVTSMSEG